MHLKKSLLTSCCAILAILSACDKPCRIVWTEGPADPESGKALNELTIVNPPAGTDWTVWFCQFRTPVELEEGTPATIEHLGGTLYRVKPEGWTSGEELKIRYQARPLVNRKGSTCSGAATSRSPWKRNTSGSRRSPSSPSRTAP